MSEQNTSPSGILTGIEPAKPAAPAPEAPDTPAADTAPLTEWNLSPAQMRELATVAVDGFHAAQMHEYEMPDLVGDGEYTPQIAAFDRQARTWLSTAGLPKDIGSAIASEVAKVSAELRDADDTTRELYQRTETAKLHRLWPDEGAYSRRVALARKLVQEIEAKAPGLVAVLEHTGAGNSAAVVANLALHAERLYQTKYPKG